MSEDISRAPGGDTEPDVEGHLAPGGDTEPDVEGHLAPGGDTEPDVEGHSLLHAPTGDSAPTGDT